MLQRLPLHAHPSIVCALRLHVQWMTSVLQPLNERAAGEAPNHATGLHCQTAQPSACCAVHAAIVQGGFSLLEGNELEPQLLQLVAHVSASRVILER